MQPIQLPQNRRITYVRTVAYLDDGNATEDLVFLAYKLGLGTGVDFVALWDVVYEIEKLIGRKVGGRIRAWWESSGRLVEEGPQLDRLSPP